jgi:imidazole glycerol-phosphate synthase subunit HisF
VLKPRVIPCLLLREQGLVKTVRFRNPSYIGDPINAVRIFNEKEVDELTFLDISASIENRPPPFDLLARIASEAFMPFAYGGGIRTIDHVHRLLGLGVDKICLNTAAVQNPAFIGTVAKLVGSQSVVVSIDAKRASFGGYHVLSRGGTRRIRTDPPRLAAAAERSGAGEILLQSVDRDGTVSGYDLELITRVTDAVGVPVIACGGARNVADLAAAIRSGASAAAAGSMFVFKGPHRAVLISYPDREALRPVLEVRGTTAIH